MRRHAHDPVPENRALAGHMPHGSTLPHDSTLPCVATSTTAVTVASLGVAWRRQYVPCCVAYSCAGCAHSPDACASPAPQVAMQSAAAYLAATHSLVAQPDVAPMNVVSIASTSMTPASMTPASMTPASLTSAPMPSLRCCVAGRMSPACTAPARNTTSATNAPISHSPPVPTPRTR